MKWYTYFTVHQLHNGLVFNSRVTVWTGTFFYSLIRGSLCVSALQSSSWWTHLESAHHLL